MSKVNNFLSYYKLQKEKIDQSLVVFNNSLIDSNPFLNKNFSYFKNLNSDGKNIRGVLVTLGYHLLQDDMDYSIPLATAYEIFQTAILIHDDIIDKDDKRREKETIHKKIFDEYKDSHLGNSIALCMGDYGLYSANKVISTSYKNNKNLGKILNYFNDTVLNTIKGEMLDVILPIESKKKKISSEELEKNIQEIYRLKTSHYTIIGPLCAGLLLGDAKDSFIEDITKFGEKVGIAFQIQDDILGIYSNNMGKIKGSDMKEYKQTILFSHIINTIYKEEFLEIYGTEELSEEKIEKVKRLLEKSGSKQYAIDKMNQFYDESTNILDNIDWLDSSKKELLRGFVEYLRNRNK